MERTHTMWKPPAVLDWLQSTALAVASLVNNNDPRATEAAHRRQTHYSGIPRNILRHVFISEFPATNPLLPAHTERGAMVAHDPFPPKGVTTEYDELAASMSSQAGHGVGFLEMFFRSLIPGFENVVAQLAAQRQRQQRRGGGGGGARHAEGEEGGRFDLGQWLAATAEEIGVDNLLQTLLAQSQDDGAPDAALPDDYEID